MSDDQPQPHPHALTPPATDTADDLVWASLEIQRAQRQIVRGVSELAEGIVSLSLVLLEVRRRRLFRFDPEFPTFEAFVEQRHSISADQAITYVEALISLGEANYRLLVSDIGFQRTYALAMLKRTDPALVTAFQALPQEERRAATVAQIEAVDTAVTEQIRARVEQLEQSIVREQGLHQQTRRRLQEVEELHQRVTNSLIEERDSAQRALDQEQSQAERLRTLLAEARRQGTSTPSAAKAPAVGATAVSSQPTSSEPPAVTEAVIVVMTFDVPALVTDVRGLTEKLGRLTHAGGDIATEQRASLTGALAELNLVIAALLDEHQNA